MSEQAQFRTLCAKRSTSQGVVTRHLNSVRRIISSTGRGELENCKHQLEKLFSAKKKFDDIHDSVLEAGFLASVDTTDMERAGVQLSDDVIATCEHAKKWMAEQESSTDTGNLTSPLAINVNTEPVSSPGDAAVWKSRFLDLQKSQASETAQLRALVSSLTDRLDYLTEKIGTSTERAASTPARETHRRVTFDGALDLTKVNVRDNTYVPVLSRPDYIDSNACERHVPHMTYGGHGHDVNALDRKSGLMSTGPPPAHIRSHTSQRPLQAVPETRMSPPYTCSSRTSGVHGHEGYMKPLDLSNMGNHVTRSDSYPLSQSWSTTMQQHLLDQSQSHHRSIMASVNATTAKLSKFDGNPLEFAPFVNSFDELFDSVLENPRAKLAALINHCEGRALKVIRWCIHKPAAEGYAEARRTLRQKFGTPFIVSQAWLAKLLGYQTLRTPEDLESFACDLRCCRESLECLGYLGELQCTNTLRLIVVKLPMHLRNRWRKVHRQCLHEGRASLLDELISLVSDASDDINDPAFSERAMEKVRNSYNPVSSAQRASQPTTYRRGGTFSTAASQQLEAESETDVIYEATMATGSDRVTCASCSSTQHFTAKCRRYKEKNAEEKLKFVLDKKLCTLCLSSSHGVDRCGLPWRCQEKGCRDRHHTSLHSALVKGTQAQSSQSVNLLDTEASDDPLLDAHCCMVGSMPFLPVTSVMVRQGDREFETFALLDTASTITLSTKSLSDRLQLSPVDRCKINLNTVSSSSEVTGDLVDFEVRGITESEYHVVRRSMTVRNLPVSIDHIARAENLKQWSHLSDLRLPCAESTTIDILIGQDNAHLLLPLESIVGDRHQPYAVRTPLGWTVYGVRPDAGQKHSVNTCITRKQILRGERDETVSRSLRGDESNHADMLHCEGPSGRVQAEVDLGSNPVAAQGQGTHDNDVNSERNWLRGVDCNATSQTGASRVGDSETVVGEGSSTGATQDAVDEIKEVLERFWKLDSFPAASRYTKDEQAVIDLWEKEIKFIEGHIQLPIPYKSRPPGFPDNFLSALYSLKALGRGLKKDLGRLERYRTAMGKNFTHRFAEYVKKGDKGRPGYTSYLTHHDVYHDKKPGVTRVVKSGKGKYKGIAMCELVFQGPDLMNQLNGVLLRFRQYEHATLADIEGMFNQVLVPEDERDSMRFLYWKNGDPDDEIVVCRMRTHIFGMVWSPAACMFALKKSAELFGKGVDEDILQSIRRNFYVDDWHNSEPSEQKAIRKAMGVDDVVGKAGFNLTKHMSNNRAVIEAIPPHKRAKELSSLDLSRDKLPRGATLGLGYDPEDDAFHYNHVPDPRPETRRGLMSCVASLYDPLGLVAPFVLVAKMMLQQVSSTGAGWDDVLPEDILVQWRGWLRNLDMLSKLRIPRWLGATEDSLNTLHNFGDASEKAYGGASLLLTETVHGDFMDCHLVYAKSKLAPLKTQSIPRLELCASTVCVRMDEYLRDELDVHLESSHFWTDSMLVLFYMYGDPANYKPFMANRVAFCQEATRKQQWSHVPGELNPADVVSRGAGAEQLIKHTLLYNGPEFLRKGRASWPPRRIIKKMDDTSEVRKKKAVDAVTCMLTGSACGTPATDHDHDYDQLDVLAMCTVQQVESVKGEVRNSGLEAEKASRLCHAMNIAPSWESLKRQIALLRRFALWYQSGWKGYPNIKDVPRGPISSEEMVTAEINLVKMSQRWHLDESSIATCKNMKKLDITKSDGLWVIGGRLVNAALTERERRPMLIPAKSAVARLIVLDAHVRAMHAGVQRTVMEVRLVFWVCQASRIARGIINACVMCSRLRGRPAQQKMADLPEKRLAFNTPAFYHTGVDMFGPLMVRVRRGMEKRYGALYTCMSTRAVHIEVALDLTTSAFLATFERFVSRRGTPSSLQSDNGKNFVGGRAALKEAMEFLKDPRINKTMVARHIKWTTNSPSASHQGGIWERMIRSTRELLMVVLKGEIVTPDKLHTALCKIEWMINSRPITKFSESPDSMSPLTPSDILTLRPPTPVFPAKFSGDRYRKDYKQANLLMDRFWKLWLKRYLPELQKRTKWHTTKKNCYVGELVILIQDQYPRCDWPLGVIREVFPGKDGLVRNVVVRTKDGDYRRPIQKLVRLEGDITEPD